MKLFPVGCFVQQERRNEALATLADAYKCFTQGFDTGDLIEANDLL